MLYIYVYIYTHTYIYIYIHINIEHFARIYESEKYLLNINKTLYIYIYISNIFKHHISPSPSSGSSGSSGSERHLCPALAVLLADVATKLLRSLGDAPGTSSQRSPGLDQNATWPRSPGRAANSSLLLKCSSRNHEFLHWKWMNMLKGKTHCEW